MPKSLWDKVAEYCDNDVIATETLFYSKKRQADFVHVRSWQTLPA